MDYPVVGYDLAHNGLPSFPDVVYMDTSGQYDQSVFQLTQGDKKICMMIFGVLNSFFPPLEHDLA